MIDDFEDEAQPSYEPGQYFEDLKSKISETELDTLKNSMSLIDVSLLKAHRLGQKSHTHKIAFLRDVIEKEMALHATGFRQYILRDDIFKFIKNVQPKNSVKIIELERFPRDIPDENADDIERARKLGLFDEIVIVYTDLTNEKVETKEEKEFVARNRDPIAFGVFENKKLEMRHDRFYLITDWEDEFCDLTFQRMVDQMSKMGIQNAGKTLEIDHSTITRIVSEAREISKEENFNPDMIVTLPRKKVAPQQPKPLLSRFMGMFGRG